MKSLVRSSLAALWCAFGVGWAHAQPVPLPELRELLAINREIQETLRRIPQVIVEEIAANRLDPQESMNDKARANFIAGLAERDDYHALAFHGKNSLRYRTDNTNLLAAWRAFEAALETRRLFLRDKVPALVDVAVGAAVEGWRNARGPTDLSASIDQLRAVKIAIEPRGTRSIAGKTVPDLDRATEYLLKWKDLLAADETGKARLVENSAEALALHYVGNPFGDYVSLKDLEERRTSMVQRARGRTLTVVRDALSALASVVWPEDVEPLLERVQEVSDNNNRWSRPQGEENPRTAEALELLRKWQTMLTLEISGEIQEALQQADEIQTLVQKIEPAIISTLSRQIRKLVERQKTGLQRRIDALLPRLAALESPAAARALAAEIRGISRKSVLEQVAGREISELLSDLDNLGRVEIHARPGSASSAPTFQGEHPWREQLDAAYQRWRRQTIAQRLDMPELLAATWPERPIEAVFQSVVEAAETRKDWREVLRLISHPIAAELGLADSAQRSSVRAFLIGQSYEKADLFVDAIAHYRLVVLGGGEHTPIAEAGDRLKELKHKHPDLFSPPKP